MNLVPDKRTRNTLHRLVTTARRETGPDAVARHLSDLPPDQWPALIGLLLTQVNIVTKTGAVRLPDEFTEADRKAGYARYKRGHRDDLTIRQFREYQRHQQRKQRVRDLQRKRVA